MTYFFHDIPRLQLWFRSPNLCAAFLVPLVIVLVGVIYANERIPGRLKWLNYLLYSFCVIALILVYLTFSRGGWLACVCGFSLAGLFLGRRKRVVWLWPVMFSGLIMISGSGLQRVLETNLTDDRSSVNRILVWKGGCGIIARHPFTGVGGPPLVGEYYETHYQRHASVGGYSTLVNDFLTIAAAYGLPTAWFFSASLWFICLGGFYCWHGRTAENPRRMIVLFSSCALLAWIICGIFSTLFIHPSANIPAFIAVALIISLAGKQLIYQGKYILVLSCVLASLFCILAFGIGKYENSRLDYRIKYNDDSVICFPQNVIDKRINVIMIDEKSDSMVKQWLIPLANRGFATRQLFLEQGIQDIGKAEAAIRDMMPSQKCVLLGIDAMSSMQSIAVRGALGKLAVVAIDLPLDWPFVELTPQNNIPLMKDGKLYILYEKNDIENAQSLKKLCCDYDKQCELREINGGQFESVLQVLEEIASKNL